MTRKSTQAAAITQRMSKNLLGLRRDLVALGKAVQALALSQRELSRRMAMRKAGKAGGAVRKERRLSAADRERLRVQGEYLGLVRHLSVRNRARVKTLKAEKGYDQALKLARKLSQGRS